MRLAGKVEARYKDAKELITKIAGADPLDGTNHFAAGGTSCSVMAHYVEEGIPQVGMVSA